MVRLILVFGPYASAAVVALHLTLSPAPVAASHSLLGPIDLAPIGTADYYSTNNQASLVVQAPGVLANDIDLDGDALVARLVSGPANGTLTLAADGGFRYQPVFGFSGVDTFTYRPFDGVAEALLPATVSINVAKPSATPKATSTPTPTPTPTPSPTPTPKPTLTLPPLPTPTPSLPPLPIPTPSLPPLPIPTPTPSLPPHPTPTPSLPPLPVATPSPTPAPPSDFVPITSPGPTSSPSGGPGPTSGPTSGAGPSSEPSGGPDAAAASAQPGVGGLVTGGDGPSAPGGPRLAPTIPLSESGAGPVSFGSFGDVGMGIEWIVPSALVTVPGFLLIVIGLAQAFGGFAWLPLARRWLRGDGRRPAAGANRFPN